MAEFLLRRISTKTLSISRDYEPPRTTANSAPTTTQRVILSLDNVDLQLLNEQTISVLFQSIFWFQAGPIIVGSWIDELAVALLNESENLLVCKNELSAKRMRGTSSAPPNSVAKE